MCVYIWRPEDNLEYHCLGAVHLVFETEFLVGFGFSSEPGICLSLLSGGYECYDYPWKFLGGSWELNLGP